jgi:asparagine synthase (glutamine-hydrolysing)
MCGICGLTATSSAAPVEAMNALMVHRGPDDEGTHFDAAAGVALGARRLSVIDVEGGHQPLSNEDGSVWAVLNGEIYNHPALLDRLRAGGHTLASRCDTEVLVHLYEDYGDALVHALEGQFAFAVWDARRRRLLLGRDRFGEKPLFYCERSGELAFASEASALTAGVGHAAELDAAGVDAFFVFGYVPGPETILRDVRHVPPGSTLTWDADERRVQVHTYWSPPVPLQQGVISRAEAVGEVDALLTRSVRSRMVADVPLGVLLSGGVDSTLIAAVAADVSSSPVKTFTVGYDVGEVNETEPAREAARALGTDHHELVLTSDEIARGAPGVIARLDQPLADQALVAMHAVSAFARREVTVAVGGEGADELFGGYPRYRWMQRAEALEQRLPGPLAAAAGRALAATPVGHARELARVVAPASSPERQLDWVTAGRRHARETLYGPRLRDRLGHSPVAGLQAFLDDGAARNGSTGIAGRLMRLDQRHWLADDVLVKADRASMQVSLEVRTPYLHPELAEVCAAAGTDAHLGRGGKAILREVLERRVPGSLAKRGKTAFRVPAADWLRGPLAETLERQLESSRAFADGWFAHDAVRRLSTEHAAGRDRSAVLWPLMCFGLWLDGMAERGAIAA